MKLVIDLEASCWSSRADPRQGTENEIIEIGCVVTDDEYNTLDEFQTFVKPVRNPILTDFCVELTSITQDLVDKAPLFAEAMLNFQTSIFLTFGKRLDQFHFCSWGNYDRNQFAKDCEYHKTHYPFGPHKNVKKEVAKKLGRKPMGCAKAAAFLDIPFAGTHHRGIDDARVITAICRKILAHGS